MLDLIQTIVALEMLLLPVWVGAAFVRPPRALGPRLARVPAPVVLAAACLLILAAVSEERPFVGVIRAQAVAVGWLVLLVGLAAALDRLAGRRPAQMLTVLLGWLIVSGVILAGPVVELMGTSGKETVVRAVVHGNALVVAEEELGLKWLHQDLSYRLTPIGESYGYLFGRLAWWKTLLAHLFVGTGLLVFSVRRRGRGDASPHAEAAAG